MEMNFERSPQTDAIVSILRQVNDDISYVDLALRSNLPVSRTKELLGSARRILRRQKIMFGTILGEGLKRLGDTDKVRKSEDNKKRMARAAGRAIRELDTIEAFERLSNSDQLIVTTNRTILNLTRGQLMTKPTMPTTAPQAETPSTTNLLRLGRKAE